MNAEYRSIDHDVHTPVKPRLRTLLIAAVLVLGTASSAGAFAGAGDDYQGSLKPQVEQIGAPLDRADAIAALKSTSILPESNHRDVDRVDFVATLGSSPETCFSAHVSGVDRADSLDAMRGHAPYGRYER